MLAIPPVPYDLCISVSQFHVYVVVGALNQKKVLVGAFSVITNQRMDLRFKLYYLVSLILKIQESGILLCLL